MRLRALAFLLWLGTVLTVAAWQAGVAAAGSRQSSQKSRPSPTAKSRAGSQKSQAPAAKTKRPSATARPSGGTARTAGKTATSRKSAQKPGTSRATTARARVQQTPTPQRYAEIQRALIERGYLSGPATGNWGPESVEALKRFQQDNNLEPTGRINALTLIALGLGPNRASLAADIPPTVLDGPNTGEKPE